MELEGKIIKVFPSRSGTTERGTWMSQDYLLEHTSRSGYVTKMLFTVYGSDRIQRFAIQEGQTVNMSFTVEAHEYEGRWFNQVRAFDVRERRDVPAEEGHAVDPNNPFDAPPKEGKVFEEI